MTARVDDCCGSASICGDHRCQIFGASAEGARSAAAVFATKRDADMFVERRIKPRELRLPAISAPPAPVRKVGLFERLIAGPQGDVTLREDFLSFLGCLACGVGLAAVILAVVMAARELLP